MTINFYSTGHSAMMLIAGLTSASLCAQPAANAPENTWTEKRVCSDLVTPAPPKAKKSYLIASRRVDDGTYGAVAFYPDGTLRMDGRYLDAALTHPHGEFRYYHPNGALESQGHFVNGNKEGAWVCFDPSGAPRADRHYIGGAWDELQVAIGLATLAPVVGDNAVACAPGE